LRGRYRGSWIEDGHFTSRSVAPMPQMSTRTPSVDGASKGGGEGDIFISVRLATWSNIYDRRHGAPREGPALLQGLAVCGGCGTRMTVRYHHRKGRLIPEYNCSVRTTPCLDPTCQVIPGGSIKDFKGLPYSGTPPSAVRRHFFLNFSLSARTF
jgi:hypothetical protein